MEVYIVVIVYKSWLSDRNKKKFGVNHMKKEEVSRDQEASLQ